MKQLNWDPSDVGLTDAQEEELLRTHSKALRQSFELQTVFDPKASQTLEAFDEKLRILPKPH